MIVERAFFHKFAVDPETIIPTLPSHKPCVWDADWEIVCVPDGNTQTIYEWAKENGSGIIDTVISHTGDVLVAFSDPTDAILFKISYQNGVTVNVF